MDPNLQPQDDAMAQAIARRGLGQTAPQMSPQMAPQGPAPQMPSMSQQGGAPAKFEPSNKEDFIVSTLAEELKRSHDLKKEHMKFGQQAPMM